MSIDVFQGRRGLDMGEPSEAITVQFGVDGSGFSVMGAGATALKMAA
jgi:hypothetical protein